MFKPKKISSSISSSTNYTSIPIFMSDGLKEDELWEKEWKSRKPSYQNHITFRQYLFSSKSLLARLLFSFCPPIGSFQQTPKDYSGTLISIFLLTALLAHKTGKTGFPFPVLLPFTYVLIFSVFISLISKLTKTNVSLRELFCLGGYGLVGATVTLLFTSFSDRFFFPCLILFTGLNSLRITLTLFFKTRIPALRFILGTPTAIIHALFPVYLYYATKT